MSQTTTLEKLQTSAVAPRQREQAPVAISFFNVEGFELMQRIAKAFSQSDLVPKQYQGNLPNCMIALDMSQRIGADPLQVMQNLVIVHGRPTWSSQFLIATVNTSGRFSALRFEFFGEQGTDAWGCRAWAIEKTTGEKLVGSDVTIAIAKAEGWYDKNGSKWKTMPQQMLMYRAGSWWTRAFAPELSMGLQTSEEAGDVFDAQQTASGSYAVDLNDLRQPGKQEDLNAEAGEVIDVAPAADQAPEGVNTETGEIVEQAAAQQQAADDEGLNFE